MFDEDSLAPIESEREGEREREFERSNSAILVSQDTLRERERCTIKRQVRVKKKLIIHDHRKMGARML